MTSETLKMTKLIILFACVLFFAGCGRRAYDEFTAMGGLCSDWPQFAFQSLESNLLIGEQPVDAPSAYRDQ